MSDDKITEAETQQQLNATLLEKINSNRNAIKKDLDTKIKELEREFRLRQESGTQTIQANTDAALANFRYSGKPQAAIKHMALAAENAKKEFTANAQNIGSLAIAITRLTDLHTKLDRLQDLNKHQETLEKKIAGARKEESLRKNISIYADTIDAACKELASPKSTKNSAATLKETNEQALNAFHGEHWGDSITALSGEYENILGEDKYIFEAMLEEKESKKTEILAKSALKKQESSIKGIIGAFFSLFGIKISYFIKQVDTARDAANKAIGVAAAAKSAAEEAMDKLVGKDSQTQAPVAAKGLQPAAGAEAEAGAEAGAGAGAGVAAAAPTSSSRRSNKNNKSKNNKSKK